MLNFVQTQALQYCFISYRIRHLTFCESPAVIALAAFDKAVRKTATTEGINIKFTSARQLLEQTLTEPELAPYGKTPE